MKIKKHIDRGILHKTFCEDYFIDEIISKKYRILCVFDGCSSGKDSHFASALLGKCVLASSKQTNFNQEPLSILQDIIFKTILNLKQTKENLNLQTDELLSTLILLLLDTEKQEATIIAIGDGFISVNKKVTLIEQNNQPNYLAYYIN